MKNFSYLGLFLLFIGLAACSNNTNSKAIEAAADAQLTGVYTNGNHDLSWIFFLDVKDGRLAARLLEIEGMLPPREELEKFLPALEEEGKLTMLTQFKLKPENLSFTSELGPGQFKEVEGTMEVTFQEQEGFIEDKLRLWKSL